MASEYICKYHGCWLESYKFCPHCGETYCWEHILKHQERCDDNLPCLHGKHWPDTCETCDMAGIEPTDNAKS